MSYPESSAYRKIRDFFCPDYQREARLVKNDSSMALLFIAN